MEETGCDWSREWSGDQILGCGWSRAGHVRKRSRTVGREENGPLIGCNLSCQTLKKINQKFVSFFCNKIILFIFIQNLTFNYFKIKFLIGNLKM